MRELALFAGIGGGILGGMLLGWETVCAVELDAFCARRLMQRQDEGHLSPFPIWDDVRTFDGRPWRGLVDVVSGGFPCQDISIAGKGSGITGSRSGLWVEMARIIGEVCPQYAFIENSPMLRKRGLNIVLRDLAELGFNARWGVLGGFSAGLCVNRKRLWIIAHRPGCNRQLRIPNQIAVVGKKASSRRQFVAAIGESLSEKDHSKRYRDSHVFSIGMDRMRAIGNGQVPVLAELAWNALSPFR